MLACAPALPIFMPLGRYSERPILPLDLTVFYGSFLYGFYFAPAGLTQIPVRPERIETRSVERPSAIDRPPKYQEIIADPQPRTYRKVLLKDGVAVGMLFLGDRSGGLTFKRTI